VCPCEPAEDLLRRHLVEIDAELARLTGLRAEVAGMLDASLTCAEPVAIPWCPPSCPDSGEGR
jgi:hypothetical protein